MLPADAPVEDEGAAGVADIICHGKVEVLDLSYRRLGVASATVIAKLIESNSTVTDLNLYGNKISQPSRNSNGFGAISEVVEDLTGGSRQQIAAGLQPPLRIEPIKASD